MVYHGFDKLFQLRSYWKNPFGLAALAQTLGLTHPIERKLKWTEIVLIKTLKRTHKNGKSNHLLRLMIWKISRWTPSKFSPTKRIRSLPCRLRSPRSRQTHASQSTPSPSSRSSNRCTDSSLQSEKDLTRLWARLSHRTIACPAPRGRPRRSQPRKARHQMKK